MESHINYLNQKEKVSRFLYPTSFMSLTVALCLVFAVSHFSLNRGNMAIKEKMSSNRHNLLFSRPLNLNEATMHELVELPGIGEKSAGNILSYRQRLGFFLCMEELSGPESPIHLRQVRSLSMYGTVNEGAD